MKEMSQIESPEYGLVLLMETLLVLTNPGQTFKGPAATVGSVSWEAGKVLLSESFRFVVFVVLLFFFFALFIDLLTDKVTPQVTPLA